MKMCCYSRNFCVGTEACWVAGSGFVEQIQRILLEHPFVVSDHVGSCSGMAALVLGVGEMQAHSPDVMGAVVVVVVLCNAADQDD